jgi:hypothetical protein
VTGTIDLRAQNALGYGNWHRWPILLTNDLLPGAHTLVLTALQANSGGRGAVNFDAIDVYGASGAVALVVAEASISEADAAPGIAFVVQAHSEVAATPSCRAQATASSPLASDKSQQTVALLLDDLLATRSAATSGSWGDIDLLTPNADELDDDIESPFDTALAQGVRATTVARLSL